MPSTKPSPGSWSSISRRGTKAKADREDFERLRSDRRLPRSGGCAAHIATIERKHHVQKLGPAAALACDCASGAVRSRGTGGCVVLAFSVNDRQDLLPVGPR